MTKPKKVVKTQLSSDSCYSSVKIEITDKPVLADVITAVGYPMKFLYPPKPKTKNIPTFARQSFLGKNSQFLFENIRVGLIGYGGGGSHIGQQLAHLGVKHVIVFDDDTVEESNLNRLVGAWFTDVRKSLLKTAIAKRVIKKIFPQASVECLNDVWQKHPERLQQCDIVIGGVDTYSQRNELEAECRRYLMPLIDMGMDVHNIDRTIAMSGQVILSMPEMPCMQCYGFLTEAKLAIEAAKYGKVGGRPQVVWPNGVLASTAVGIFVDLVTGWTKLEKRFVYLGYDGNSGTLTEHPRATYIENPTCIHYNLNDTGPPRFTEL